MHVPSRVHVGVGSEVSFDGDGLVKAMEEFFLAEPDGVAYKLKEKIKKDIYDSAPMKSLKRVADSVQDAINAAKVKRRRELRGRDLRDEVFYRMFGRRLEEYAPHELWRVETEQQVQPEL